MSYNHLTTFIKILANFLIMVMSFKRGTISSSMIYLSMSIFINAIHSDVIYIKYHRMLYFIELSYIEYADTKNYTFTIIWRKKNDPVCFTVLLWPLHSWESHWGEMDVPQWSQPTEVSQWFLPNLLKWSRLRASSDFWPRVDDPRKWQNEKKIRI